ncbi:sulfate adenylyltransferase subunit 1 [Leifsonia sp. 2MCAF36]|uniref:sulfate adenylyltransferase subunit 1 n=1 Tax=Leifsonia sp. 2MCAF36 TaxID=3232988 RepID=UPI003F9DEE46
MTLQLDDDLRADSATAVRGTLFRFATAGSVDDGKSTLVGRLLHDSKAILADHLASVERTSRERGFGGESGGLDLALFTDGLRAEREQGITIDVAYRYFATDARSFILADCPGHVQYTRNMVTGATTADAVVLLVDARHGVLEQTRRHLAVISLLRVPHVIVAINKIDLIDFDAARVQAVSDDLAEVAAGLGIPFLHIVPVCAVDGDNVAERSPRTPWYRGPALLELLESLPAGDQLEAVTEELRLPVQLVLRPQGALAAGLDVTALDPADYRDYRSAAGRIASGSIAVGDRVSVHPGGATSVVTRIDVAGRSVAAARAPQSAAVSLADDLDLARGALIAAAGTLPQPRSEVTAEVFWLDAARGVPGARLLLKWGTSTVQARLTEIEGRRDLTTLQIVPADALEANDIGHVTLRTSEDLPFEPYADNRQTGAFLLIDPQSGATLAAGIVSGKDQRA